MATSQDLDTEPQHDTGSVSMTGTEDVQATASGDFSSQSKPEKLQPDVEYECWMCGARSYHLKVCGVCQHARYCDRECQTKHWLEHRKTCSRKEVVSPSEYFKGGRLVEVNQVSTEDEKMEVYFLGLDKCPKNGHNGHSEFIGVKDFGMEHLPERLKHPSVLEYIRAESKMTVRVKVKYTSPKRPDSDACAKHRGCRFARTASGLFVLDNPTWFESSICQIPKCHRAHDLGPAHKVYQGDLKIFTNKHVIFDEDELAKATVDFFYDSDDKEGLVQEYAIKLFYLNAKSDKSFVTVTIHDEHMFRHLYDLDCQRAGRFREIPLPVLDMWRPSVILISHPHGMPKKISIGQVNEIMEENTSEEARKNSKIAGDLQKKWFATFTEEDYWAFMKFIGRESLLIHKMTYDTPSCPGSSGGPVLIGGAELSGVRSPIMANHNGYDLDSTLNYFKASKFLH